MFSFLRGGKDAGASDAAQEGAMSKAAIAQVREGGWESAAPYLV